MLALKRFARPYRFMLLILLLVCALSAQTARAAFAQEASPAGVPEDIPQIETVRAISTEMKTPLAFLSVPNLTWSDIAKLGADADADASAGADTGASAGANTDAGASTSAIELLKKSAFSNLSATKDWEINLLLDNPHIGRYTLADSVFADSVSFSSFASTIDTFIKNKLPEGSILIIVTAPAFNGGEVSPDFTPVIIYGEGFDGYLTSDATHRRGLITAGDFISLQNNRNEPVGSPDYSMATIDNIPTDDSVSARAQELLHDRAVTDSVLATKKSANFTFLTLVFLTFALSILLLILGGRRTRGSRGVLIPTIRILWLIVLAFPPATFLMFCQLPVQPGAVDLVIANTVWVILISLAALLVGWRTKWVNSLIALYGLTISVILIGQIFGGPLNTAGYLTYDITEGSRYYGMGNEQGAMLFGSWITLSGLLINRYPKARGIPAFKSWGYPLGSFVLLFIATSPWFGASFGPLIWGFLGCFFSWWLFNGWRLRWWLIAAVLTSAFGLALGVLYADVAFNPVSHMSQVIPSMEQGFFALVSNIATDVWRYSFSLIRDYVPAVVIAFLAFVFILLVVLRVLQPGTYREFWQRNTAFRAVYSVCFILAAVTFVLEDSGVFTPAVLLIYPIACFVWLICDLHSWHLRTLAEGGGRSPVTLRELQQRALGLLSHDNEPDAAGAEEAGAGAATGLGAGVGAAAGADARPRATKTGTRPRGAHFRETTPPEPQKTVVEENAATETPPSVGRSAATMSAATLLSRLTGFVRTWAMAFALGNTILTSAYTIANNLPNMLYELIAGGVLTTAFLPIYLAQLEKRGKDGASSYAANLLSISAIALGVIALIATVFAPQVVFTQSFLNSDFDVESAVFFFRFFAIQVIFYGVGAIISGLLNAHRNFLWPALGPVFNNITVIITLFAYPFIARLNTTLSLVWLAAGTTLGVVAMFIVQIPALRKLGIPLRFHVNLKDPALKDTLKMALPAMLFIIMNLIAVSVMNAFALSVTPKGPSTILFAWLWYQLPYGVIAVALSTALLTEMSEASAAGNWEGFRANVRLGLRSTIFLIIPLATIIFTLSNQLAGLYHAGAFTYEDVLNVARMVAMWCVALPFYACYMFIYRIFSSMRELTRFIIIDAIGRVLLVALYGFFTTGFGLFDGLGLVGIPLADACVYALLSVVMLYVLRRRIGSFGLTQIVSSGAKVLVAALIANVIPFILLSKILSSGSYEQTILVSLATIAICGAFALGVYYFLCRLLKVPETDLIASRAKTMIRKLRKKDG
jgi:putative peptidoglycan lipid II flippase